MSTSCAPHVQRYKDAISALRLPLNRRRLASRVPHRDTRHLSIETCCSSWHRRVTDPKVCNCCCYDSTFRARMNRWPSSPAPPPRPPDRPLFYCGMIFPSGSYDSRRIWHSHLLAWRQDSSTRVLRERRIKQTLKNKCFCHWYGQKSKNKNPLTCWWRCGEWRRSVRGGGLVSRF